jgi:pilus assembly protein CpaB
MSSMDSLREKLRGRKSDTQDLAGTGELDNPFTAPEPTGDLPSTAELSESLFGGASSTPPPPKKERRPAPATDTLPNKPEKPRRVLPFMDKLQALEVNKKMLGISAAIAALASFMALSYLNSIADPLKGQSRMVKVMVLKQDVSPGTALAEPMIEIKEMPIAYLPKGYMEYKPGVAILGKVATTSLFQGEVIHDKRVAMPNTSNTTVASQLPEGHRAFTITAPNAYLMKPGDYVDIMASLSDPNPTRRGKLITIPILQRSKLLVVGGQYSTEAIATSSSNSRPSNDITVAVPEDRLNLMTLLSQKGNFSVSVRPPNDQSITPDKYTIQEIEDALLGKFDADAAPVETVADTPPEKPKAVTPVEPDPPLVDLSAPAAPAYRAPARTYTPPRNTHRAPARTYTPPKVTKPAAVKPVPPKANPVAPRPAAPRKTVTVINGGSVVQQDGGTD